MREVIGRTTPHAFAIFRIVTGLLFACHGGQKLLGFPPSDQPMKGPLPPMVMAAGIIELVCGIAIALGLFVGIAAFVASGEMAVAYFTVHAKGGFWPILNHGELAVLYCFTFLYFAAHGAGMWSLDSVLFRRRAVVTTP
jgi:putative oxidoreductase